MNRELLSIVMTFGFVIAALLMGRVISAAARRRRVRAQIDRIECASLQPRRPDLYLYQEDGAPLMKRGTECD